MAQWINVKRELFDGSGMRRESYIQCPFCLKDFPTRDVVGEKLSPFHFCPNCGLPLNRATNKQAEVLTDWVVIDS